ncbi:MAG: phosphoserine transaminase [Pseudomonadota bacterium]
MTAPPKPHRRPANPHLSSGPCAKRPGYSVNALDLAALGRSHRAEPGKGQLAEVCARTAGILGLPEGYRVGVVPGSDTGAFEMAMWTLLGQRPIDILAWESFGSGWVSDVVNQLKLPDVRRLEADYGDLPALSEVRPDADTVFTWNGTTSGVRVPNGDWIDDQRSGLTLCDATSAVFAMDIPWAKIDVATFSWQKALGGEGAHGVLILSPRAVERLETYTPSWPVPKVFRLTKGGKLIDGIFRGATINTPSMLCVADCLDALTWVEDIGGVGETQSRTRRNAAVLEAAVAERPWLSHLARDPATRSTTSVCLAVDADPTAVKSMVQLLAAEAAAFDVGAYRDAPAGLRIWCGPTVETADLEALVPWLDWAFYTATATATAPATSDA